MNIKEFEMYLFLLGFEEADKAKEQALYSHKSHFLRREFKHNKLTFAPYLYAAKEENMNFSTREFHTMLNHIQEHLESVE